MQTLYINRDRAGVYDWCIAWHSATVSQGDMPEASIEGCLRAASLDFLTDERFVNVWYRTICIGTMSVFKIENSPADVADEISDKYSALIGSRS